MFCRELNMLKRSPPTTPLTVPTVHAGGFEKMEMLAFLSSGFSAVADVLTGVGATRDDALDMKNVVERLQYMVKTIDTTTTPAVENAATVLVDFEKFLARFKPVKDEQDRMVARARYAGEVIDRKTLDRELSSWKQKLRDAVQELDAWIGIDTNNKISLTLKAQQKAGGIEGQFIMEDGPTALLGEGQFCSVYRMLNKGDRRLYAVKRIDVPTSLCNGVHIRKLEEECEILCELAHEHISRYFVKFYSDEGKHLSIVMELIGGGTLSEKVTCDPAPAAAEIITWARQMASALNYMHDKGVLHSDLKPENVMLTGKSEVKIIDFGLACVLNSPSATRITAVGSLAYSSHEKANGTSYDGRDDVYAMGCILLELLTSIR
jgi:predicted Ser/Thr protein kinase